MPFQVNIHSKALNSGITSADVSTAEFKVSRLKDEFSRQKSLEPRAAGVFVSTPFVADYSPYGTGSDSVEGIVKTMLALEKKP